MAAKAGAKPKDEPANDERLKPDPDPGHNERAGLSQQEWDDLLITHLAQGREDNDAFEAAMEIVRGVRKRRTRNRNLVETDGYGLKDFDDILRDEQKPRAKREEEAAIRTSMRRAAGMPVLGAQQTDLFAMSQVTPEAVGPADEARARADGYEQGLRGAENVWPDWVAPENRQAWNEEWYRGQERLAKAMETRAEVDARRLA